MSLVDTIAGHPAVYNLLQDLAGRRAIQRRVQPWLDRIEGRVLDVGGGTGRYAHRLRPDVRYVCLDLEAQKLRYLRRTIVGSNGLVAEAAALPFAANSFDAALLIGVTHHLSADALRAVIQEIQRVLVPSGRLIMLDAVAAPERLTSRALWSWDRGNHPRIPAMLDASLREFFHVEETVEFNVLHHYVAMSCRAPLSVAGFSTLADSRLAASVGAPVGGLPQAIPASEFD